MFMAMLLCGMHCDAVEAGAPKLMVRDAAGQVLESANPGKRVFAWGQNNYGQSTVPAAAQGSVVAIVAASYHTVALKQDGSVVAWGRNDFGQTSVPAGLSGVVAIAAGAYHTVALKQDGSVVAWGSNDFGQTSVPTDLSSVVAIAANDWNTVALKQDGSVVAWGRNDFGQASVPKGLSRVKAIAAGWYHLVALMQDGSVVAWGGNDFGQASVPKGLSGVRAIAAGWFYTIALKQDGRVVAWGRNESFQASVPANLSGVVAITTGGAHTVALKQDGRVVAWGYNAFGDSSRVPGSLHDVVAITAGDGHTVALTKDGRVVAWGYNFQGQTSVPKGLGVVTAIAAGRYYTVAIADPLPLVFPAVQLGQASSSVLTLSNAGTLPLALSSITITGPDADQFRLFAPVPASLAMDDEKALAVQFQPKRVGTLTAQLHIASNDPASPDFVLNLQGTATYEIAAEKAGAPGAIFTYAPLRLDRSTGLLLHKITFTNTTGFSLNGLRLILSKVASGVQVYSSNAGEVPGTFEVIYSSAIKANETITFDLVYFDPKRRTAESMNPVIKAEALLELEPDSLPVTGTIVPLLRARSTPQGPTLEWNSAAGKTYVVEYSDDGGTTWLSAVHRLSTGGTRMFWLDRGQPETKTKPTGVPNQVGGRYYRVKRL